MSSICCWHASMNHMGDRTSDEKQRHQEGDHRDDGGYRDGAEAEYGQWPMSSLCGNDREQARDAHGRQKNDEVSIDGQNETDGCPGHLAGVF